MKTTSAPSMLVALMCLVAPCLCVAQDPAPKYTIKEDDPRLGSTLRRDQFHGFSIAINLPYAKLPTSDRQSLHALYEQMPDGDEPPFPIYGLQAIYDPIRKAHDKLGDAGDLSVIATVDASGQVQRVEVFKSPSTQMSQFAASVLTMTKFKPALCAGKPCAMEFPVRLSLTVEIR